MNISNLVDKGFLVLALVCALALMATIAGCNGEVTDGRTHSTIGGTVSAKPTIGGDAVPLEGATIEARKGDGSDDVIASTTTDPNGQFSLSVPITQKSYLHISMTGYTNSNTVIAKYPSNDEEMELIIYLETALDNLRSIVFPDKTLADNGWFMIDALDSNGVGIAGVQFTSSPNLTKAYRNHCTLLSYDTSATETISCPAGEGRPMIFGHNNGGDNAIIDGYLYKGGIPLGTTLAIPMRKSEVLIHTHQE